MTINPKNIDALCAFVYRERLDECDTHRVTDEQCLERGRIYRPVVIAALIGLGLMERPVRVMKKTVSSEYI